MKKALALKTVDHNLRAYNGFQWPAEGPVECPDWNPEPVCGGGLHALLWGQGSTGYLSRTGKFLIVEVNLPEVVDLGDKVKFPRGVVRFCGDCPCAATAWLREHMPSYPAWPGLHRISAWVPFVRQTQDCSPAVKVLYQMHDGARDLRRNRYEQLMRQTVHMVIRGGLRFDRDDFAILQESCGLGLWLNAHNGEDLYALAAGVVRYGEPALPNIPAAVAIEVWKKRRPFWSGRKRLAVGSILQWHDLLLKITSFSGTDAFIACGYRSQSIEYGRGLRYEQQKVDRRLRITRQELADYETARYREAQNAKNAEAETDAGTEVASL